MRPRGRGRRAAASYYNGRLALFYLENPTLAFGVVVVVESNRWRSLHGGQVSVAVRPMRHLSLCAGYGGLDLGLTLALGERGIRTVCYVEREASAAATLVARMEDSALDQAPVWDCLETFDGAAWRGAVDIVSAGFPCQPWSQAGKRQGTDDERWLWPAVFRVVVDVAPGLVMLENVPGLVTGHGLEYVLSDLAEAGFDAEWGYFSAGEVGASHRRQRVFILADAGHGKGRFRGGADGVQIQAPDASEAMADAEGYLRRTPRHGGPEPPDGTSEVGDAERCPMAWVRTCGEQEPYAHAGARLSGCGSNSVLPPGPRAIHSDMRQLRGDALGRGAERSMPNVRDACERGSDLSLFPPSPADRDGWARILAEYPDLAPAVGDTPNSKCTREQKTATARQQRKCATAGTDTQRPEAPQPALRGVADGCPGRVDRLRMLGNGVVPLQAAYAFQVLAARIEEDVK